MSFLKEERGESLKKRWNLVIEKWSKETLLLVSHWTHAPVGASESSHPLGGMLAMTSPVLGVRPKKWQFFSNGLETISEHSNLLY